MDGGVADLSINALLDHSSSSTLMKGVAFVATDTGIIKHIDFKSDARSTTAKHLHWRGY
jgi:hypothetical protein